jgi:hypothetical protein
MKVAREKMPVDCSTTGPAGIARAERDRARIRLEVLVSGLGQQVQHGYFYGPESADLLREFIHEELEPAIDRVKRAEKAYEPYWHRRRIRRWTPRKKQKQKKGTAA